MVSNDPVVSETPEFTLHAEGLRAPDPTARLLTQFVKSGLADPQGCSDCGGLWRLRLLLLLLRAGEDRSADCRKDESCQ